MLIKVYTFGVFVGLVGACLVLAWVDARFSDSDLPESPTRSDPEWRLRTHLSVVPVGPSAGQSSGVHSPAGAKTVVTSAPPNPFK